MNFPLLCIWADAHNGTPYRRENRMNTTEDSHIFVCYARRDIVVVSEVIEELEKRGHRFWMDKDSIAGTDEWRGAIGRALERSKAVIFFGSEASYASMHVRKELTVSEEYGLPLERVMLGDSEVPPAMRLLLAGKHYVKLRDGRDVSGIHRIDEDLKSLYDSTDCVSTRTSGRRKRGVKEEKSMTPARCVMLFLGLGIMVIGGVVFFDKKNNAKDPISSSSQAYPAERSERNMMEVDRVEIEKFVMSYLESGESDDVEVSLRLFAKIVDYYGKGKVSKKLIRGEKKKYYEKWPFRSYQLLKIDDVQYLENGQWMVDYRYRFQMGNTVEPKEISGEGRASIVVQAKDERTEGFEVVSVSEEFISKKVSDAKLANMPNERSEKEKAAVRSGESDQTESKKPDSPGRISPVLPEEIEIIPSDSE